MNTVQAELNCGRWIVRCPDFPDRTSGHALVVIPGETRTFICPKCYEDALKMGFLPVTEGPSKGMMRPVPDVELRQSAEAKAAADGKVWQVVFPPNVGAIMDAVRMRPAKAMSWMPGETIADLNAESSHYGWPRSVDAVIHRAPVLPTPAVRAPVPAVRAPVPAVRAPVPAVRAPVPPAPTKKAPVNPSNSGIKKARKTPAKKG